MKWKIELLNRNLIIPCWSVKVRLGLNLFNIIAKYFHCCSFGRAVFSVVEVEGDVAEYRCDL